MVRRLGGNLCRHWQHGSSRRGHYDGVRSLSLVGGMVRPSSPLAMPIKSVQVLSLDGAEQARLIQILNKGTQVQVGDVVAIVETDQGSRVEIASPLTGQLTQHAIPLHDVVRVGDHLLDIDTDVVPERSQQQLDGEELSQHLQDHQGELQDDFFEQYLMWDDIDRLKQLVFTIRDRFPRWSVKSLTLLEYILKLQAEQDKPAVEVAATHTDLGIVLLRKWPNV